jgi:hypothetical protein
MLWNIKLDRTVGIRINSLGFKTLIALDRIAESCLSHTVMLAYSIKSSWAESRVEV